MTGTNNKFLDFASGIKSLDKFNFLDKISLKKSTVMVVSGVLAFSYILAIVVSSFIVSTMLKGIVSQKQTGAKAQYAPLKQPKGPNYVTVRLAIMDRNLFNSEGEFPDESSLFRKKQEKKENQIFDPHAKCEKSSLKLKLLGTIYIGNSNNSLATMMEDGYSEADIYRVGDAIIGQDDASIVAIERKKVVVNNSGNKECIEVEEKEIVRDDDTFIEGESPYPDPSPRPDVKPPQGGEANSVTLQSTYVEKELGDGFAKIINAARLVPNLEENQVQGFKIFAIKSSSILKKIGLKNGDIITRVNDVSLKDPAQGFALFEAMQNEREINIHVLRGGKTPVTLRVKIK